MQPRPLTNRISTIRQLADPPASAARAGDQYRGARPEVTPYQSSDRKEFAAAMEKFDQMERERNRYRALSEERGRLLRAAKEKIEDLISTNRALQAERDITRDRASGMLQSIEDAELILDRCVEAYRRVDDAAQHGQPTTFRDLMRARDGEGDTIGRAVRNISGDDGTLRAESVTEVESLEREMADLLKNPERVAETSQGPADRSSEPQG